MKNLIKIIFAFTFIYLNASDLLNNLNNTKESKYTKIRQFFYLTKNEKDEKLKQNELELNLKNKIINQIAKNNEHKNPLIDLNQQMPEINLFRKKGKKEKIKAEREIAINNFESNIKSNLKEKENNNYIQDIVLNIKNNENEAQNEIEKNLNEFDENIKTNENKFNKILDIHNMTENLAQLHIIGQSKAEKKEFEDKIKHLIHAALQIATVAGTIYITIHNIQK